MRQGNSSTSWNTRVAFTAFVLMTTVFLAAQPARPSWPTPRIIYQQEQKAGKAEEMFMAARESFDAAKWSEAVAGFEQFIALYPQDKNVPAAHYWLATALKKQSKYAEADERLARLINEFPKSSWANDARALRVEIAGLTRNTETVILSASDGNESVRLAALQSLMRLDPPRAIRMITDMLRPDSKESENMKMSILTLLGRGGGKAAVPLLTQVLNDQPATDLRVHAIYALAQIDDPAVLELLKRASDSDDKQVAEASLFAIARLPGQQPAAFISEMASKSTSSHDTRQQSILLLGEQDTDAAVESLLQIYDAAEDVDTRTQTILALGMNRNPRAQAKLWEIARQQDANAQLRSKAILALAQRGESKTLNELAQFYDQEKSEEIKRWIILALAQPNERVATRKLMTIAKTDPSQSLRRLAVLSLQRSNDPEVRKFLQENGSN